MDRHYTTTTTLRDYLRIIFKRKFIFVITIIPIIIINYVILEFDTPAYTASVKILIKAQAKLSQEKQYTQILSDYEGLTRTHKEILTSKPVVERVVKALKLYELPRNRELDYARPIKKAWIKYVSEKFGLTEGLPPHLSESQKEALISEAARGIIDNIEVEPVPLSSLFVIKVVDYNPSLVEKIANALSLSFVISDLEQQIAELKLQYGDKHSAIIQLDSYVKKLSTDLDGGFIPDAEDIGPATIKIMERAQVGPLITTNKTKVLLYAFLAGILLGLTLIAVFDFFDPTIKSPRDVEVFLNMPLLGSIPKIQSKNKSIDSNADSNYVRAYKNLSNNIYMLMKNNLFKSALITDADSSNNTQNIIANMGMYLSHNEGHKVLIIDVNLRSSAISDIFRDYGGGNLVDVLEETVQFEEAIKDLGSNLYLLPAGMPSSNPNSILNSPRMASLIKNMREKFDVVLLNCPDLKNFNDAVILSSLTDCTILVVNEGMTHQQVTKRIIQSLVQKKTNLIGAILNNRSYAIPNMIYKLT